MSGIISESAIDDKYPPSEKTGRPGIGKGTAVPVRRKPTGFFRRNPVRPDDRQRVILFIHTDRMGRSSVIHLFRRPVPSADQKKNQGGSGGGHTDEAPEQVFPLNRPFMQQAIIGIQGIRQNEEKGSPYAGRIPFEKDRLADMGKYMEKKMARKIKKKPYHWNRTAISAAAVIARKIQNTSLANSNVLMWKLLQKNRWSFFGSRANTFSLFCFVHFSTVKISSKSCTIKTTGNNNKTVGSGSLSFSHSKNIRSAPYDSFKIP